MSYGLQNIVNFGDATKFPSCTCDEWKKAPLPCRHMFTIFRSLLTFDYDSLSSLYRNNPIFMFDCSIIKFSNHKPLNHLVLKQILNYAGQSLKITPTRNDSNTICTQQFGKVDQYCGQKIKFPTIDKNKNKSLRKNTTKITFQSLVAQNTVKSISIASEITKRECVKEVIPSNKQKDISTASLVSTKGQTLLRSKGVKKVIPSNIQRNILNTIFFPPVKDSSQSVVSTKFKIISNENGKEEIPSNIQKDISTKTIFCPNHQVFPFVNNSSRTKESHPSTKVQITHLKKEKNPINIQKVISTLCHPIKSSSQNIVYAKSTNEIIPRSKNNKEISSIMSKIFTSTKVSSPVKLQSLKRKLCVYTNSSIKANQIDKKFLKSVSIPPAKKRKSLSSTIRLPKKFKPVKVNESDKEITITENTHEISTTLPSTVKNSSQHKLESQSSTNIIISPNKPQKKRNNLNDLPSNACFQYPAYIEGFKQHSHQNSFHSGNRSKKARSLIPDIKIKEEDSCEKEEPPQQFELKNVDNEDNSVKESLQKIANLKKSLELSLNNGN